jgi:AraC-like DNA-binding protein
MARTHLTDDRGVLHARLARERFAVTKSPPPPELAPFVDFFWVLVWDLRGRPPHRQRVLTRPTVHMTFTDYLTEGTTRARVTGVVRDEFAEVLTGEGRVVGVGFLPGGFRTFLDGPVSAITGRFPPVTEVFGAAGAALATAVHTTADPSAALVRLERFLVARAPRVDPKAEQAARVVERIAASPGLVRVDALAADLGVRPRGLQRLFHEYVGVGPKWVIRRYRMLEAAARAEEGTDVDWAALAGELGYADQAHFTRDFTASVGLSPARYARQTARSAERSAGRIVP